MKSTVAIATYVVCWLLFVGMAVSIADSVPRDMENSAALGVPLMLIVFIAPGFIAAWVASNYDEATEKVRQKVDNAVANMKNKEQIEKSKEEYEKAKSQFQYISNQSLLEGYEEMIEKDEHSMRRLALEEELVNRGLIEYSPMHEKMHALKKRFCS
jgi:hypothetical protein